jgi:hypothetical protein
MANIRMGPLGDPIPMLNDGASGSTRPPTLIGLLAKILVWPWFAGGDRIQPGIFDNKEQAGFEFHVDLQVGGPAVDGRSSPTPPRSAVAEETQTANW